MRRHNHAELVRRRTRRPDGLVGRIRGRRAGCDVLLRRDDGQAAAELVALLPLVTIVLACAWQAAVAGHALWAASAAARAAARAAAVGDDPRPAARRRLPDGLERGMTIEDPGGGTIKVTVRIPRVLFLPALGRASAGAHFAPQL